MAQGHEKYYGRWRRRPFVTHGEMTPFVIDGCENVTMKNFSLVAADPSVPEMTVVSTDVNSITARVTAGSNYEIEDGTMER